MYILAPDFFEKDDNTHLKIEIRVVCREFVSPKYVLVVFLNNSDHYICTSKILKTRVLNRFFGT